MFKQFNKYQNNTVYIKIKNFLKHFLRQLRHTMLQNQMRVKRFAFQKMFYDNEGLPLKKKIINNSFIDE